MKYITFSLASFVGLVLAGVGLVLVWFVATNLQPEMAFTGRVILFSLAVAAVGLVIGGFVIGGYLGFTYIFISREQLTQAQITTDGRRAEVDRLRLVVTTAAPGDQIIVSESGHSFTHKPMHLAPGQVNGRPGEFDLADLERWKLHQLAHATRKSKMLPLPDQPQIEAGPPPPLLPAIVSAQRLLIVGASNTGKTTVLKHLISQRRQTSQVLCIDPHGSPPKWGSVASVGAGRDYEAIEQCLNSLVFMMTERYREIGQGLYQDRQHPLLLVVIDEWRAIVKQVDNAGECISSLLTEARKVSIDLIVASHSDRVEALGVKGEGDLRAGFTVVRLSMANDQRRAALDTEAGPLAHALPGPFEGPPGLPDPKIIALPAPMTAQELAILDLIRQGENNYQICKAMFDGKRGANYHKIDAIRANFGVLEA